MFEGLGVGAPVGGRYGLGEFVDSTSGSEGVLVAGLGIG